MVYAIQLYKAYYLVGSLSELVPYPGRELVWPGFGIYIHPVAQQVPGGIGRGKRVDLLKSKSWSKSVE
jgi:hypothetical protein